VLLQLHALHLRAHQVGPAVALGDGLRLAGEGRTLVGHLEEQQEGELLQVVLVAKPVVAQHIAVRPELLNDAIGDVAHALLFIRRLVPPSFFADSAAARAALMRLRSIEAGSSVGS
jgi:hypothetical protein